MVIEWLPLVFTAGWGSGVNAYAVVLMLSLLGRFAGWDAVPELLTRPSVLIGASVLFLIEAFADKIPYVDSAWDVVHTVIRPAVGASLGLMLTGEASSWEQAAAASTGGGVALAAHLAKASMRLAVNTSPEPVSNIAVSTGEDLAVGGVLAIAIASPWLAAAIAACLLVIAIIIAIAAWRLVRRGWRAWKARRGDPATSPAFRRAGGN